MTVLFSCNKWYNNSVRNTKERVLKMSIKMNKMPGVMKTQELEIEVVKIVKSLGEEIDWRNDGEVIDTFHYNFDFETDTSIITLETYLLKEFTDFYADCLVEFDSNRFITQVFHNDMSVYNPNNESDVELFVCSLAAYIDEGKKQNIYTLKITHIADCKDCPYCRAEAKKNKKKGKK
jgi:hypothetical protein